MLYLICAWALLNTGARGSFSQHWNSSANGPVTGLVSGTSVAPRPKRLQNLFPGCYGCTHVQWYCTGVVFPISSLACVWTSNLFSSVCMDTRAYVPSKKTLEQFIVLC
jgi:hypothetical protein